MIDDHAPYYLTLWSVIGRYMLKQVEHKPETCADPVGAGSPAKKPTRCLAPAAPVFAGEPAPTKKPAEAGFLTQQSISHHDP
ncbi:hypothetical protein ACNFB1_18460 [Pseudomonas sp. NY15349]|uniref:hypothetical protein n=1 Tax=Pseudomonas sp. NY15349 TaxID=3400350 RepID=UPI003A8AFC27